MLINGCNPCCLCILWSLKVYLLTKKIHLTLFCFMYTGNNLNKGRFTCTIFAHQCMNFTGF